MTSYDKAILGLGSLAVAVCAAAGVDASRPVEAVVGLLLVLLPVFVYWKANRGISYAVASKCLAALPASVGGVFLLFGIDVTAQLTAIGQQLLAVVPVLIAISGNGAAKPVSLLDQVDPNGEIIDGVGILRKATPSSAIAVPAPAPAA